MPTDDERGRVLAFWWMLELFSPQQVPTPTRKATQPPDRQVVAWHPGDELPWETLTPPEPLGRTPRVWRHTVYLGVYRLDATYESIGRVFGDDPDAYDKRPDGTGACAGLLVDQEGRLISDSATLSSALWAVGRTRDPGPQDPQWMDGFEQALEDFGDVVDALEDARRDADGDGQPPPQDADSLTELLASSHVAAGVEGVDGLATDRVTIESVAVSARRADDGADAPLLNSFYLDDLATVRRHVAAGDLGAGLAAYLTGDACVAVGERVDVVARPEAVEDGTQIHRLPKGRWPAEPTHSLALSQQFAVNRAVNDLGPSAGLMGVNGPPGTGKTTMLRDILAANVVDRARQLAALRDPSHAFTDVTHRWTDGEGRPRTVRQLRPELTGFEMVVASANNAAVENVSADIPDRRAIASPWKENADYFGQIATEVLRDVASGDPASDDATRPTAWGLVAARLGRKKNRSSFHSTFWFDEKSPGSGESERRGVPRMQTRLTQWRDGEVPFPPWGRAREAFKIAERRVDLLISERAQAQDRLRRLSALAARQRAVDIAIGAERRTCQQIHHDLAPRPAFESEAEAARSQAAMSYDRHVAAKPGVVETILSLGRSIPRWRTRLETLARALDAREARLHEVRAQGQHLRHSLAQAEARLIAAQQDLSQMRDQHDRLERECARDRLRFEKAYPGPEWRGDRRELHTPWLDEELDTARSDLFIAALQLHQDFLANAARDMVKGLRAACEVVAGSQPRDLEPEKVRAAWQLFFLTVPLVSTTFASAGRMFGNIGRESIGWLFVDEAGQASPQYAVGAIWRAQRTIVVGDPLQLEPVVALPEKAQRTLASAYRLSGTWIPPRASVQTLADRVTVMGTELDQGERKVWVSSPLRVHRRCDDPMFTLCNQIAYSNLMVDGVHRELDPDVPDRFDGPAGPIIAASHWADEPSRSPGSHLQPNQIDRLVKALAYLETHDVAPSEVIVVSPFRAVADRLRSMVPDYPGLRAGTIHTAQGREAPVVILVLGGDPGKPGAPANWAKTPNLVNVAASRAKRRLYVIGDRGLWAANPYFTDLAHALDR